MLVIICKSATFRNYFEFVFSISALLKMERVSARHKGDKQAIEMLKVRIILLFWRRVVKNKLGLFWQGWFRVFEPVQKNEPNTTSIKVTPDMTPFDVMSAVLKTNNWSNVLPSWKKDMILLNYDARHKSLRFSEFFFEKYHMFLSLLFGAVNIQH